MLKLQHRTFAEEKTLLKPQVIPIAKDGSKRYRSTDAIQVTAMKLRTALFSLLVILLVGGGVPSISAQTVSPGQSWTYRLLEGSTFLEDCPVCGRPAIVRPMRGTFDLILLEDTGTITRYALSNVSFAVSNGPVAPDRIVGNGTYTLISPGPARPFPEMTLRASINDSTNAYVFTLDTNAPVTDRAWPVLQVSLIETQQATLTQVYHMDLLAAPLREIWFSTVNGFSTSTGSGPTNRVSAGDLISDSGRVVRRNARLLARLGIMPGLPEIGIDAADIAPGGETLFSLNKDVFSETLGPIQHGDLLSERGKILKRNQDLMAAFKVGNTNADYGLDAFQVMANGEIYFSIATNAVSPQIGALSIGDLLSDQGRVVKTHIELLAGFHPPPSFADQDHGLDALYVWPSGEIWFSLEQGFEDQQLGPILDGDLLSDQGHIVFRNLELTSAFAPLEDVSNFGLDALYLVSDATPPAPAPQLLSLQIVGQSGDAQLQWTGAGRVFQLEKSAEVSGPFLPVSPILPDSNWIDANAGQTNTKAFYRLRQW